MVEQCFLFSCGGEV